MYKYAHILHGQVHEIINHHAAPDVIQQEYYSPELVLINITDDARPIAVGWLAAAGVITEPAPEPQPTIEALRAAAWNRIKAKRDAAEREPLPYMEKLLDFDSISSERLTWAVNAARSAQAIDYPFEVDWTTYDGSILHMTANDIIGIPLSVAQRSDALHQKARGIGTQLQTAQTAEEIATIEAQW